MASAAPPLPAKPQGRRTQLRRRRRLVAALALLTPALWTVAADLARRGAFLLKLGAERGAYYLASVAVSVAFWSLLVFVASRRRGIVRHGFAALFIVSFVFSTGVQGAFFWIFHTYDSVEGEIYTRSLLWPWVGSLPLGKPAVWIHFVLSTLLAVGILRTARGWVRPRPRTWWIVLPFAVCALGALRFVQSSYHGSQASTSDVLYFHALVANARENLGYTREAERIRPQKRHALSVPAFVAKPSKPRNVLLILQESQRFDVTCTEYDPDCQLATRSSNSAVPERLPFLRWHSLASSTNLSCLTLWTGLLPSDPKEDLESAPTLFGYAKAAGYSTAYLTSQHVMFQNMRMQMQDEPIDRFAVGTTLSLKANWDTGAKDSQLSDYAIKHWDELPEPFFAIVHYSNQHSPYVVDANRSPFASDPDQAEDSFDNRIAKIKNVTYLSDLAVGRLLQKVKASDSGQRTVIMYTSDHSEGQGDHGWSGHTVTMYESEIHVPAWLDAPPGALTADELEHLRASKNAWLTHADLTPTFLDLMGAWDAPELAPFRTKMLGRPLTRALPAPVALPMTNDSWLWESSDRNWGYLRGGLKLFGTDGARHYKCFDLEKDPGEKTDLGEAACGELGSLTRALFPALTSTARPYRPLR